MRHSSFARSHRRRHAAQARRWPSSSRRESSARNWAAASSASTKSIFNARRCAAHWHIRCQTDRSEARRECVRVRKVTSEAATAASDAAATHRHTRRARRSNATPWTIVQSARTSLATRSATITRRSCRCVWLPAKAAANASWWAPFPATRRRRRADARHVSQPRRRAMAHRWAAHRHIRCQPDRSEAWRECARVRKV